MPTTAALDDEALRICAAMDHIKARGNLDGFRADRSERVALMYTAARQGLVLWDKSRCRYELTSLGEKRLGGLRTPVNGPSGWDRAFRDDFVRSRTKSGLLGAVAGAAACAGLIAWLPSGPPKPSALQAGGISDTGPPEAASEQPAAPAKEPIRTTARAGADVQADQLARSFSDALGESQAPAAVADRGISKKRRDAQQSRKVAHAQKKTGRKTRPADSDDRAVVPGYGSGPPFTTSERRPLLGSADDDRRNTGRPTQYGSPPSGFFRW